ncbi:MAG: CrcB family protein [Streptococcaceae bacterium]|jgi:CrcB protein|nr:CrcB family protein [Streptococcaceae bacterium]
MTVILIGIFAGLGAVTRYLFGKLSMHFENWQIPWGTHIVNIAGSFMIGLFFAMHMNETLYQYLATGYCGGLTTFSSFNFELFELIDQKKYWTFIKYFLLTYGIGFISFIIGIFIGNVIF